MAKQQPVRNLDRRVVVITGASSGFGKGAARAFASQGASLVLAARRDNLLHELARECESAGVKALAVPTDVSSPEEVQRLAEATVSAYGRVDVWINGAGVGAIGRYDEVPLQDHIQVLLTNLLGTMVGSYFALKLFREQRSGTLINIASALGKMPAPYYASYTAAKHGVVGLSAALRQELRENRVEGIHVCTVMPMAMDTPFFEHAANYTGHESVPIPPLYDPELVIDTILRLADKPEDEVIVGPKGKVSNAMHRVAPALVESKLSRDTHRAQIEEAPPARATSGAVRRPSASGTEVSGGLRGRQSKPKTRK